MLSYSRLSFCCNFLTASLNGITIVLEKLLPPIA
jgi:hypothetical protein